MHVYSCFCKYIENWLYSLQIHHFLVFYRSGTVKARIIANLLNIIMSKEFFLIFERKWSKYMMERGHFGEKWQIFANFMYKRVGFKNCQNGSNFTCSCFSCIKWDFWELFKKRFPLLYIPQQSFVRSRQNTIVCCWVAEIKSGRFVCLQVFQEKGTSFSIWEESEPHSMIFFAWTILRVITLF